MHTKSSLFLEKSYRKVYLQPLTMLSVTDPNIRPATESIMSGPNLGPGTMLSVAGPNIELLKRLSLSQEIRLCPEFFSDICI